MANIGDILDALCADMPLETAEDYDNPGLLAGSRAGNTQAVICALDLNTYVINEAVREGAGLIVTHHPILFRGRKNLREDDPEGRMLAGLIRAGVAHIAMHTNFDCAKPGVNDVLAAKLGLENVEALESGMRVGSVPETEFPVFADMVEKTLGGAVRRYGRAGDVVKRVAVMGGAGGSYAAEALSAGADMFVTGEISYHNAADMYEMGMRVLEAGHAATELPAVELLAEKVRAIGGIKVIVSGYKPFL